MKLLAMDTSSQALSVALLEDEKKLAEHTLNVKKNHSISLMPTIDFLMDSVGWAPSDLDRIVVAEGPGSYTGLRVAVATAKTLAYTLSIDLVGVSSLYALAAGVQAEGLVIPLMDARRNNVYAAVYRENEVARPASHLYFPELLSSLEGEDKLTFVGEVTAFREQIKEAFPTAEILETLPSAYELGLRGATLSPSEVHSFVPQYLKRVEAEENWLQNHQVENEKEYIKRV